MVKEMNGNILDSGADVICHQVNCQGAMGAGLAKQIRQRWPDAYEDYINFCSLSGPYDKLGEVKLTEVSPGKYIAHAFAQLNYGRKNLCYTSYDALSSCFEYLARLQYEWGVRVAFPYGIGCGLAGGDWNVVRANIEDIFGNAYADCEIWKLPTR